MSHTIRLRDPWQHELTAAGGTRWTRAFHQPTGLSEREKVWLVVSDSAVTVWLGEQPLTASSTGQGGRYEITNLLADYNRLAIEVSETSDQRPFEASLEIDAESTGVQGVS